MDCVLQINRRRPKDFALKVMAQSIARPLHFLTNTVIFSAFFPHAVLEIFSWEFSFCLKKNEFQPPHLHWKTPNPDPKCTPSSSKARGMLQASAFPAMSHALMPASPAVPEHTHLHGVHAHGQRLHCTTDCSEECLPGPHLSTWTTSTNKAMYFQRKDWRTGSSAFSSVKDLEEELLPEFSGDGARMTAEGLSCFQATGKL